VHGGGTGVGTGQESNESIPGVATAGVDGWMRELDQPQEPTGRKAWCSDDMCDKITELLQTQRRIVEGNTSKIEQLEDRFLDGRHGMEHNMTLSLHNTCTGEVATSP
jgi:hypothetical protein